MRKAILTAVTAALFFFLAACGDDYGRDDAVNDMIDGGLTEEQANCVADGAEENDIPWDATEDSAEPGGEHFDAISEIVTDCLIGG